MKDRAIRRKQKRKFFKKALKIIRNSWIGDHSVPEEMEHYAHLIEKNRKSCGCQKCRNPRHSNFYKGDGKLTMQEILEKEKLEDGNLDQD
ncbi:MAG: hypothetical protein M0P12_03345 [Paludibacteraceae bacterium]|nr:hypothetical protein [Paludibacteraceae bacterium]